ncbi:MAG: amidohydrolase family protein [Pseudomonadota bacterium]
MKGLLTPQASPLPPLASGLRPHASGLTPIIIDIHTHIFPPEICQDRRAWFPGEPAFELLYRDQKKSPLATTEGLIEAMDLHGIQASVTFGFPWKQSELIRRSNDYVLEAMARYPDRLLGFACLNPGLPGATQEGERCLEAGMKGLGEIALYLDSASQSWLEAMKPLAELAEKWKVPILLHTNEPVGPAYPGKERLPFWELYDLIKLFPKTIFILAHWGGGLWWYELMKREVREVLRNTYFDTAASPFLYRPEIYQYAVRIMGVEKILYGSDYPLLTLDRYLKELEQAGLNKKQQKAVLGGNSQRILGWPAD